MYHMSAKELALRIMEDIKETKGITATAGIGTNLYLAKVALDIMAKHAKDNIGYLNEELYQKTLWKHQPLTDFWRIGKGIANRLNHIGIFNMGDITCANEDLLYRLFGIDAELLIDHAWGRETTTMADIKAYKPKSNSLSNSQVLARDYSFEECRLIVKEMTDALCLDMADKNVITGSMSLMIGYSNEMGLKPSIGTAAMSVTTNSYRLIIPYVMGLYERIGEKDQPIRRLSLSCNNLVSDAYEQYDLFTDQTELEKDRKLQRAALEIKQRFGKNALVRGMDLQQAGTTIERNRQIGGHKSGD